MVGPSMRGTRGMSPKIHEALQDWTLHRGGPLEPEFTVVIEIYQKRWTSKSQRFRWRAKTIGNWRKLAHGGEGYSTVGGLTHALKLLWPNESGSHIVIKFMDGRIIPFNQVKE